MNEADDAAAAASRNAGYCALMLVTEEFRLLGAGVNCRALLTIAEGEGGRRSDRPSWCSEVNEGTFHDDKKDR